MLKGDIIIKRDSKNNYSNYDLKPLDNIGMIETDDKFIDLLILIKKVLLNSNNSYFSFLISQVKKILLLIFIKFAGFYLANCFFCILNHYFEGLLIVKQYYKLFPSDNIRQIINRILIIILPDLIILLVYKLPKLLMKNKSILNLMFYINERYQYAYNNTNKYDLICKINNDCKFDIHLFKKNKISKNIKLYINTNSSLSKNIFFDYLIIYSNGLYEKFNYKMCNHQEIGILVKIFEEIKKANITFDKNNKSNLSYRFITGCSISILEIQGIKYNIIYILIIKIIILLVDAYLDKTYIDDNKLEYYEQVKKQINNNIFKEGYFCEINNDIIIIYRLKQEYNSLEEDYQFIYSESKKLLDLYLNS